MTQLPCVGVVLLCPLIYITLPSSCIIFFDQEVYIFTILTWSTYLDPAKWTIFLGRVSWINTSSQSFQYLKRDISPNPTTIWWQNSERKGNKHLNKLECWKFPARHVNVPKSLVGLFTPSKIFTKDLRASEYLMHESQEKSALNGEC